MFFPPHFRNFNNIYLDILLLSTCYLTLPTGLNKDPSEELNCQNQLSELAISGLGIIMKQTPRVSIGIGMGDMGDMGDIGIGIDMGDIVIGKPVSYRVF